MTVTGSPIIASRPTAIGIRLLEWNQKSFSAISQAIAHPTSTTPQGAGATNRARRMEPTMSSIHRSVATLAGRTRNRIVSRVPLDLIEFPADDLARARRFWETLLDVSLEERSEGEGQGLQTHTAHPSLGLHERG